MAKKISEITQPLGIMIDDFHICPSCGIVARKIGYPCLHCGQKDEPAGLYFSVPTVSLINLMQKSYRQKSTEIDSPELGNDDLHVGVLIFFCTLTEVLLENFLRERMYALNFPSDAQELILESNKNFER